MNDEDLKQHLSGFHQTVGDAKYHEYLHRIDQTDHEHNPDGSLVTEQQEPPYRMCYMEDLKPGMVVLETNHEHEDAPAAPGMSMFMQLMQQHGRCRTIYKKNIVVEVRHRDEYYSCILVNEEGKQEPLYGMAIQLVPVASDTEVRSVT